MARRVERTRNAGTWTEAQYWQAIRSALRNKFKYWKPIQNALLKARRKYRGTDPRRRWSYVCATCKTHFPRKAVEVDHRRPVGTLKSYADLPQFVKNLTAERGYQVLCKPCHQEKTNVERVAKNQKID